MYFPLDWRTLAAVILILAFAHLGLGRTLPFDTSSAVNFISNVTLFISYLYLMRTLIRLPVAAVITVRRTRYARRQYKLNGLESLRDGYTRGFLDARRWTVEPLALMDRVMICMVTLLATCAGTRWIARDDWRISRHGAAAGTVPDTWNI